MVLLRRASTVTALTLASRLLGFVRDAAIAALFGAGSLADAAVAGLAVPQLARRLLGEGALNGAIVPALLAAERGRDTETARRLGMAALTALVLLAGGLALLFFVGMPALIGLIAPGFDNAGPRAEGAGLVGRLAIICLPLMAAAGALSALANAAGRVTLPALSPLIGNVAVLVVLGALAVLVPHGGTVALFWLALATVIGAASQLAVMVLAVRGGRFAPDRSAGGALRAAGPVLAAAGPALLASALPQLRFLVAWAAASGLLGGVAALFYAGRLVELPLGMVGASAGAVLLPALAGGAIDEARTTAARGIEAALALTVPAAFGLALLADPIVVVLFYRGAFDAAAVDATAGVLALIAVALPVQAVERVLSAVAFAHGLGTFAAAVGLAALAVGAVVGFGLVGPLGLAGPAVGLVTSAISGATALLIGLGRRGLVRLDAPARYRLPRLGVAACAMAVAIALLARHFEGVIAAGGIGAWLVLMAIVAAGVALYVGLARALGGFDMAALRAGFKG